MNEPSKNDETPSSTDDLRLARRAARGFAGWIAGNLKVIGVIWGAVMFLGGGALAAKATVEATVTNAEKVPSLERSIGELRIDVTQQIGAAQNENQAQMKLVRREMRRTNRAIEAMARESCIQRARGNEQRLIECARIGAQEDEQ